jgi:hypothetical protein
MHTNPKLRPIAPINMFFELNGAILPNTIVNLIGTDNLTSISLECGNGQILSLIP